MISNAAANNTLMELQKLHTTQRQVIYKQLLDQYVTKSEHQ